MLKVLLLAAVLQAAPPADVVRVNQLQHAYTLMQSEAVDGAAAGLILAPTLSLVTNWYQQASTDLQKDGISIEIDVVLADLMSKLSGADQVYFQPYVQLIVTLRRQALVERPPDAGVGKR